MTVESELNSDTLANFLHPKEKKGEREEGEGGSVFCNLVWV